MTWFGLNYVSELDLDEILSEEEIRDVKLSVRNFTMLLKCNEELIVEHKKNGKNNNIILRIIDNTKPKCAIVGMKYEFNSHIAKTLVFQEK